MTEILTLEAYPDHRFMVSQGYAPRSPYWELLGESIHLLEYEVDGDGHVLLHDNLEPANNRFIEAFLHFLDFLNKTELETLEVLRRYARIFHEWSLERSETFIDVFTDKGGPLAGYGALAVVPDEALDSAEEVLENRYMYHVGSVFAVQAERFIGCKVEGCHLGLDLHWVDLCYCLDNFESVGDIFAYSKEEACEKYAENYLCKEEE